MGSSRNIYFQSLTAVIIAASHGFPPTQARLERVEELLALLPDRPDVLEVDLNPVIATAAGALAVDALVVLEGPPR